MSTQTKWTPGPWEIVEYDSAFHVCRPWDQNVTPSNSETFGSCHGAHICDVDYNSGVPSRVQAQANARLISLAPEMAEALRSIAENLSNRAMSKEQEIAFANNPQAEHWRVYLSSLIIQARNEAGAILAKLEGGDK